MVKLKLNRSAADAAQAQAQPVDLRDGLISGLLCKIAPLGSKVFTAREPQKVGTAHLRRVGIVKRTVDGLCKVANDLPDMTTRARHNA